MSLQFRFDVLEIYHIKARFHMHCLLESRRHIRHRVLIFGMENAIVFLIPISLQQIDLRFELPHRITIITDSHSSVFISILGLDFAHPDIPEN